MRATADREEFFQFQRGEGRLKLIERLVAAYRAGELPDYMLEFVDSLRTRVKSGSSCRSSCPQNLTPRFVGPGSAIPNVVFSSDFRCCRPWRTR
jgi:hypothetical protein